MTEGLLDRPCGRHLTFRDLIEAGETWRRVRVGVATTLGAMVVAYGLMERRQYLAASYAATTTALGRLEERLAVPGGERALVEAVEALLGGEHAAWVERMTRTIATPPAPPPAPARPDA